MALVGSSMNFSTLTYIFSFYILLSASIVVKCGDGASSSVLIKLCARPGTSLKLMFSSIVGTINTDYYLCEGEG